MLFGVAEVFVCFSSLKKEKKNLHGRGLQVVLLPVSHCTFFLRLLFTTSVNMNLVLSPPHCFLTPPDELTKQLNDTQANLRHVALRPLFEPCGTWKALLRLTWSAHDLWVTVINYSALMRCFHIILTQRTNFKKKKKVLITLPDWFPLFLHYTLTFWSLCMSSHWKHTSWPAGRVCYKLLVIHPSGSVPFFCFYMQLSWHLCYVRWFLQWFFQI